MSVSIGSDGQQLHIAFKYFWPTAIHI